MPSISQQLPAIILAAGKGTRLRPYTDSIPKPLLEIGGHPILEYILTNLIKVGIRYFVIITGYKEEIIRNWIQNVFCVKVFKESDELYCFQPNAGNECIGVSFIHQDTVNGTGGAALLAETHIKANGYKDFFLTYGDILVSKLAYQRLIETYLTEEADAYIVGNPTKDPSAGAAIYYNGNNVIDFIEKPDSNAPKTDLNNSGVYIFHKDIFERLRNTKPSIRGEIELTQPIIDMVHEVRTVKLVKVKDDEFWCDVGTVDVYDQLNKDLSWKPKVI